MDLLSVSISENRKFFTPGGILAGEVSWQLDQAPEKVFLRLFWSTRGKGTEDLEVVSETVFDRPLPSESRGFKITLPRSPYSFFGRLVSLAWSLELVAGDKGPAVTEEIVISPSGYEIDLTKDKNRAS